MRRLTFYFLLMPVTLIYTINSYNAFSVENYTKLIWLSFFFFYFLFILFRKARKKYRNNFHRKVDFLWCLSIFLALALIVRFFDVQVIKHKQYSSLAMRQSSKSYHVQSDRGRIYDSEGNLLAYNQNYYDFIINPRIINRSSKLIEALNFIDSNYLKLDIDPTTENIKKLAEAKYGAGYKIVAKDITQEVYDKIVSYLQEEKIQIGSALEFDKKSRREHINNTIAPFIGSVGEKKDAPGVKKGVSGLEAYYDAYLQGKEMKINSLFSNNQEIELPFSSERAKISTSGWNLKLNIHPYFQFILSETIRNHFIKSNSEEAVAVILDPRNGKILAAVDYNLNKGKSNLNPVYQKQYEHGSTLKPMVIAGAIDSGLVTPATVIDVGNGTYRKYGYTIRESSRSTRGPLTVKKILSKSSNVGMVLISDMFSDKEFDRMLRDYGYASKTNIDTQGELKPYLPPYNKWDGLKKNTMSFGQGIALNPLQLTSSFAAIINGGYLYQPQIVDSVVDDNGITIKRNTPKVINQVVSEETSKIMRELLTDVVENGTGKRAKPENFLVGGKTGTAQISTRGGYLASDYLASFIGFFPVDKPEYVILTMFYKPRGNSIYQKYGGSVAAPAFKEIAEGIIKYQELDTEDPILLKDYEAYRGNLTSDVIGVIPDLTDLSAKEVLLMFKDTDITVEINGVGSVYKQEPAPETPIEDSEQVVKIYLK